MMHAFWKIKDPMEKMRDSINFQKNVALMGAALMLLIIATTAWPLALR